MNKRGLVLAAAQARQGAVAPYSNFKVGAALLARSGQVVTGANVESASYGLTCCAERVALFCALTGGLRTFQALPTPAGRFCPCPKVSRQLDRIAVAEPAHCILRP